MILNDLSAFFDETIRTLTSSENLDDLKVGSEVVLHPSLENRELLLQQGENVIGFDLAESDIWAVNSSNWLWLLRSVKDSTIILQGVKVTTAEESFTEALNVTV